MILSSVGQNAIDKFLSKNSIEFALSLFFGAFTAGWVINTLCPLTSDHSDLPLSFFSQVSNFFGWHGSAVAVDPIAKWFADQHRLPVYVALAAASGLFFNLGCALQLPVHQYSPLLAWLFFVAAVQGLGWIMTLAICGTATALIIGPRAISETSKGGLRNCVEFKSLALLRLNIRFGLLQAFFPVALMFVWMEESYKVYPIANSEHPSGSVSPSEGRT